MFKDNPYVIGYEFINEPFAGNIWTAPWKLIPSITDRLTLQPFHGRVANKTREVDSEHLFFFESITWDDFIPVGFSHAPGHDAARSVLSYHYYDPPNLNLANHFATRQLDMERLGTGGFLTEFPSSGDLSVPVMDMADQHLQSWMSWEYKHYWPITGVDDPFFNADESFRVENVLNHARTSPQAVSGRTTKMHFNTFIMISLLNIK